MPKITKLPVDTVANPLDSFIIDDLATNTTKKIQTEVLLRNQIVSKDILPNSVTTEKLMDGTMNNTNFMDREIALIKQDISGIPRMLFTFADTAGGDVFAPGTQWVRFTTISQNVPNFFTYIQAGIFQIKEAGKYIITGSISCTDVTSNHTISLFYRPKEGDPYWQLTPWLQDVTLPPNRSFETGTITWEFPAGARFGMQLSNNTNTRIAYTSGMRVTKVG